MSNSMQDSDIVILAGARTPFGNLGGELASLTATDLAVAAGISGRRPTRASR